MAVKLFTIRVLSANGRFDQILEGTGDVGNFIRKLGETGFELVSSTVSPCTMPRNPTDMHALPAPGHCMILWFQRHDADEGDIPQPPADTDDVYFGNYI